MSINRVSISGGLTRDCELRRTQSGAAILTFSVAVSDRRKNPKTGEWESYPNYVDCIMFGQRAEKVAQYIGKGSKVCIDGKLRWSSWKDKQTNANRSKLEVVVDDIEFMSRQGDSKAQHQQQGQQSSGYQSQAGYGQNQAQNGYQADLYDEDCPFS